MAQYLSSDEIKEFLKDLDANNNGFIDYHEVESKLDQVHNEIAPKAKSYNLHHKNTTEKQRHEFLRSVMGTSENKIPRDEFYETVEGWKVPSLSPEKTSEEGSKYYMKRMAWGRRVRAWWGLTGQYLNALARKSYYLSRMINWDLTQSFHIKISVVAMAAATLHGMLKSQSSLDPLRLVCAHGSLAILQYPMLGFWLIIPVLLIVVERSVRVGYGFYQIPAKLEILDGETVVISVVVPQKRYWKYRAGQYLLELHRTEEHPESPLTGLINETHFGRPNLAEIMNDHYGSMLQTIKETKEKGMEIKKRRVGVFFCGAPPIGYELADRCHELTVRGREDKSYIEYYFMMEVFG
ncbi:hypothetical protein M7I_8115 [Glarea lozoyensis 74030]|uniref:EF-hand domain-containing protein n=1 Tax=Glarea lozoyensis (strain ATCC 74030 / MF5533) TaxID=1104152 RepID=H0EZ53_GLAL7|nr:hypothetical protein M7I_8115 [Glarea lozoyensis 74030]